MNLKVPENQQFFSIAQFQQLGYSHYLINKMIDQGMLVKINKSAYENTRYIGDSSDFSYLNVVASKAVVCLMSAARFYGLTTFSS